jgi:hypothetical protein
VTPLSVDRLKTLAAVAAPLRPLAVAPPSSQDEQPPLAPATVEGTPVVRGRMLWSSQCGLLADVLSADSFFTTA